MSDINDRYPHDDPDVIEIKGSERSRSFGTNHTAINRAKATSGANAPDRSTTRDYHQRSSELPISKRYVPLMNIASIAPDVGADAGLDDADNAMTDGEQIRWLQLQRSRAGCGGR
jgi:hypothetical protein